jgi:hypothetical protein
VQTVGIHANNVVEADLTNLGLNHRHFFLVMGALAKLPVSSIVLEKGGERRSGAAVAVYAQSMRFSSAPPDLPSATATRGVEALLMR